jgi:hypothetical protein
MTLVVDPFILVLVSNSNGGLPRSIPVIVNNHVDDKAGIREIQVREGFGRQIMHAVCFLYHGV